MIFVFKLKCRYFGPQFPFKNIFRSVDIIPAHRDAVKVETQKSWELCVWSSMNTIAIVLIHRMMIGVRTHINDEFKLMDVVRTKNTSCTYIIIRIRIDHNYSPHLKSAEWYFIIWLNGFDGFLVICMAFFRSYTSWYERTWIRWN